MKTELLKSIPLFASCSADNLKLFASKLEERTFYKGEYLFNQNDRGTTLFIIKTGAVKVFRMSDDGQANTLTILGKGDFVGEMSLLDGSLRSATAQATLNSVAYTLDQSVFRQILVQYPNFALSILQALAKRLRYADEHIDNLVFDNTETRLKKAFKELAQTHGVEVNGEVGLTLSLSHQELADTIGARRETVSRIISKWQKSEVIRTIDTHFYLAKKWLTS